MCDLNRDSCSFFFSSSQLLLLLLCVCCLSVLFNLIFVVFFSLLSIVVVNMSFFAPLRPHKEVWLTLNFFPLFFEASSTREIQTHFCRSIYINRRCIFTESFIQQINNQAFKSITISNRIQIFLTHKKIQFYSKIGCSVVK